MTAKRNSHHKSRLRQLFATRRRWWIGIGGLIVIIIFVLVSIRHASEEKATEKNEYNILRVTEQSDFNLTGKRNLSAADLTTSRCSSRYASLWAAL